MMLIEEPLILAFLVSYNCNHIMHLQYTHTHMSNLSALCNILSTDVHLVFTSLVDLLVSVLPVLNVNVTAVAADEWRINIQP